MTEIKVTTDARYQAARALFVRDSPDRAWGDASQPTRVEYERRAETVLAAAVPHLQVQTGIVADRDAVALAHHRYYCREANRATCPEVDEDDYDYADNLAEVLAWLPADARPVQVDREALRRLLFDWVGGSGVDEGALADAVLALLSTEEAK